MPQTYHISNLIHGDIDPQDPKSLKGTPVIKVTESKISWQIEPVGNTNAYFIRLNADTKDTEGVVKQTEEYLYAARNLAIEERWFITKNRGGNYMIHRAAGARAHAYWEMTNSDAGTKVELVYDPGRHATDKLTKFLERLVQPNSGLTLDDYDDNIDNALWKITPALF